MPSNVLTTGSGAADSADQVVTTPVTVGLKGAASQNALVTVSLKDDVGAYWPVDELRGGSGGFKVISAPGTYRFSRTAESSACGVFIA